MFYQQLILLREIFQKNGYPENFIDKCFQLFTNRIYIWSLSDRNWTQTQKYLDRKRTLNYLAKLAI